ncbi:13239_t:CDS:2 [Funneliformis geosporum]|uniref:13239_t:CDS:1 n=1 Tax=Funneliformis geosporum TaxID=1117311 RepID=A0A9W4T729_9GLOM|nr:13239_t:CDS:2 [Funneliformis geosporum]
MRVEFKAYLTLLGKKKLQLGKIISSAKKRGKRVLESLNSEYLSEAGNLKSSIFLCELAEGTISSGKYNLNFVAEFITKKGFGIKYGDTNSLYLTCPDKYYEKCDEDFS